MDTAGMRARNAIASSSLQLLHCSSRAPPQPRRAYFSVHSRTNSSNFPLSLSPPRSTELCSPSESCGADALPNGFGGAVSEVPSNKEFLHVVLVSPQIPGNVGSIARTCAASGVKLHLVEPLGFQVDDVRLKRAGMDYWPYVVVKVHSSWSEFLEHFRKQDGEKRLLAFTKRGTNIHSEFSYTRGDWFVFGSETGGLPAEALVDCESESVGGGGTIRIPMVETYVRCLNLAVSVGIALYEASRQLNYEQLQNPPQYCINNDIPFLTEDSFV